MKNIFLSGGTGLVGCNLIQESLIKDIHVYAVTRGENAFERTINTVKSSFIKQNYDIKYIETLLSKLTILEIDWKNPEQCLLKLSNQLEENNIKLDAILHCASDMTYSRMNIFSSYNQNVLATSKLYDFFKNAKAMIQDNARFYFYSTAYSCGISNQNNLEDIHIGANAPSVYHLTKSYIEKELWLKTHYKIQETSQLPITIIRPSGIIGRSDNGDFGKHLIGLADVLSIFKDYIDHRGAITLDIEGNHGINFVPADVIAKWNISLIEHQNKMQDIYNIFHFTALDIISKNELFEKISSLYNISISYGSPQTKDDLLINKKLKKHKLYLENEWCFSRKNLNYYLNLSNIKDDFDIPATIDKIYTSYINA